MDKLYRPVVYIILLNWNGWRDTLNCLKSLKKLNFDNYFVVVVDNGSTDDSIAHLSGSEEITLLRSDSNLGFSGGCNIGIRHAIDNRADYIWLLNNDTIVDSNALSEMVTVACKDRKIGAVGSVIYNMETSQEIQAWGGGRVSFLLGQAQTISKPIKDSQLDYLTAASVLICADALNQVGLLDENCFFMYWEDADFSFRLRDMGWQIVVAERSFIYHKLHASTGKGSRLLPQYFNKSSVRFFLRYAPCPLWSITLGIGLRLIKCIIRNDYKSARGVLTGLIDGLKND